MADVAQFITQHTPPLPTASPLTDDEKERERERVCVCVCVYVRACARARSTRHTKVRMSRFATVTHLIILKDKKYGYLSRFKLWRKTLEEQTLRCNASI
jgi:hypothetical protein